MWWIQSFAYLIIVSLDSSRSNSLLSGYLIGLKKAYNRKQPLRLCTAACCTIPCVDVDCEIIKKGNLMPGSLLLLL